MTDEADISIMEAGTVVGFAGLTDEGNHFLIGVEVEGWQRLGPHVWVDHRAAQRIIDAIEAAGLTIVVD